MTSLLDDLDRCVMCGLCLPHCPTYRLTLNEAESPRGRLELLRGVLERPDDVTARGIAHLDHCLGCRSCEAMCPSQVPYGRLLDAGRAQLSDAGRRRPPLAVRAIERAAAHPATMRVLVSVGSLAERLGIAPLLDHLPITGGSALAELAHVVSNGDSMALSTRAQHVARDKVQLFLGCLDRHWNRSTLQNAIHLLEACGYDVLIPAGQTCCGAISQHEGHPRDAATLAERNRACFAADLPIISVSTGCSAQLREHHADPVMDVLDFLLGQLDRLTFTAHTERVALHVPCSQRNVLRAGDVTARLLEAVPDLDVVTLNETSGCCGAAGTHFIREPNTAARLRESLLDELAALQPARLLSPNLGCALHLRAGLRERGLDIPVEHPISLLARHLAQS